MIMIALAIAVCPPPPARRVTCVVDGDTVWVAREKIRLRDIDAPEMNGKCAAERALALRARDRLVALMQQGRIGIARKGKDRYGRTLARLYHLGDGTQMISLGDVLLRDALAQPWPRKRAWCRG